MAMNMDTYTYTMPTFYIKDKWVPDPLKIKIRNYKPKSELGKIVKECLRFLPAEQAGELLERITQCMILESSLALKAKRTRASDFLIGGNLIEDYGIVSNKKVTTAGVTALCVAWGNAAYNAIYMALGTGSGAEANSDTALTEITSTHYTGGVRVTCTHVESTNTVPIVGTHTQVTAGDTIAEHGIFTSATQGAAGLWDRSLTGSVALSVGDSLTATYTLTANAEA